mgnify:CR=1 FL=1
MDNFDDILGWGTPADDNGSNSLEQADILDLSQNDPLNFSGSSNSMNELLTGQAPSAHPTEMLDNLPHDFVQDQHSTFFGSPSYSTNFASNTDASVGSCHHVTISRLGYVYQDGETEVGKVDNFNMYNTHGDRAGHVSADGVVYDAHDHKVGYVDACGKVHTPSGAVIYDAHGNMINGAAYMLLVYLGGVD